MFPDNVRQLLRDARTAGFFSEMDRCAKQGFDYFQLVEIFTGLKKGLDVSIYAKPEFRHDQMHMIRLGLEKGLNVKTYLDPRLDAFMMEDIYNILIELSKE